MDKKRTDRDWERWGASSPYYGVLSVEKFRNAQHSTTLQAEFFTSGEHHVASVMSRIETDLGRPLEPVRVLDFGCGVGRLAIPFSTLVRDDVVAMDVSPSMLAEGMSNSIKRGIRNIKFVRSDDDLSLAPGQYDIVHSYIVLQHIHPARGHRLIARLAERVHEGGYLAIQFYTACNATTLTRCLVKARYLLPPANWVRNAIKSRPVFEQPMQLHTYDLSKVLKILREHGFPEANLHLDTEDSGTFESVFLLSRRTLGNASISNEHA